MLPTQKANLKVYSPFSHIKQLVIAITSNQPIDTLNIISTMITHREFLRLLPLTLQRRFLQNEVNRGRRVRLSAPVSENVFDFWLRRPNEGLDQIIIEGDGHCFIRSALYSEGSGTGNVEVMRLRNELVDFVLQHADHYQQFHDNETSDIPFVDYINQMRNSTEWADHIFIQAYADMRRRTVIVFDETIAQVHEITPAVVGGPAGEGGENHGRPPLRVAFNGVHYDFLFEVGGGEDASEVMGGDLSANEGGELEGVREDGEDGGEDTTGYLSEGGEEDKEAEEKDEVEGNDGYYEGEGDEEDSGEEDSTSDESDNNNGYEVSNTN